MWIAAAIAAIGIGLGITRLFAFARSERARGKAEKDRKDFMAARKKRRGGDRVLVDPIADEIAWIRRQRRLARLLREQQSKP